jgi:hypothetical protein
MKLAATFLLMLVLAGATTLAVFRAASKAPLPVTDASHKTPANAAPALRVLAGHALTLGLGDELARGTSLQVAPVWPAGTPWTEQAEWARSEPAKLGAAVRGATAAMTLRTAARDDALWAAVHHANIRCVELDVTAAPDQRTAVVALRADAEPLGPAFALSPSAAMRVAERIAAEFTALAPGDRPQIGSNLQRVKERLFRLRADVERRLAMAPALEVVVFAHGFGALLEDLGVQALATVETEPARWSEAERARIAERLSGLSAKVSIHARVPEPALAGLLADLGWRTVVLDPLTRAPSDAAEYFRFLEGNVSALGEALAGGTR